MKGKLAAPRKQQKSNQRSRTRPWPVRVPDAEFRLTALVQPTHYAVHVTPDLEAGTFHGEARIELTLARAHTAIEVHAADLTIERATVITAGVTQVATPLAHTKRETVTLTLPTAIAKGAALLKLGFSGPLQKHLRGLYSATSNGRRYAFTQLEAADARRFFPCFDEPSFKARFTFSVTTESRNAVISNNPIARVDEHGDGHKTVHFTTTPKLSTYLCALCVGELESSEARFVGRTPIRIWHVPGKGHLTAFALEAAVESLTRLEQYFGLPYPYEKLDLIAVPDFEAGAMENAGAVTFRETLLLVDPATITLAEKKRVAEVVAHELAHMWYGDLVTMAWWNDLWLNEAFATWMAFRVVADWKPEWRMWTNFAHHRAAALSLDALGHTHPIYAEVKSPAQATENFDAITYEKGASVVRMIESYLGANAFRAGVRKYIRRHREGNATANDLWRALEEASGQKVTRVARGWIEQPGFPLLRVDRSDRNGRAVLALRQTRYFTNPKAKPTRQRWPVPVVVKTSGTRTPTRHLMTKGRDELLLGPSRRTTWVYANAAEGGFYRPLHDDATLAALRGVMFDALTSVERLGLIEHQWAAVRGGHAGIEGFLDLAAGFGGETDFDVLDTLAGCLRFVDEQLADAVGGRPAFRRWLTAVFDAAWRTLGWDVAAREPDDTRLRRASLLRVLGEIAEAPAIVREASARFAVYLADRHALDPNLADSVVSMAARCGDAACYEQLRAAVQTAPTPQEKRRFELALTDFRDVTLLARTHALTLTDEVSTQDVGIMLVRLLGNRAARESAWQFIKDRWEPLAKRLPPMMVSRVIDATPQLQTPAYKRDVTAFFRAHPVPTAARALKQAVERFDLNDEFRRRAAKGLREWLAQRA
ncbi:MAG: M1 family metallopeptidase [Deltaproteobacteria bacterium]|nr:M1 family metallopeptidase [Deltaproteobacteria bacterium]MBI3389368.1 M1 family metallopeptidase [Deltaproteobacteria bacterium]